MCVVFRGGRAIEREAEDERVRTRRPGGSVLAVAVGGASLRPERAGDQAHRGSRGSVHPLLWQQRLLELDAEANVFDRDDADHRAVERMRNAAAQDDGYRVQLVDLAALHGGPYRRAVDALYWLEVGSL